MGVKKEKEEAMASTAGIATLAPEGLESSALLKGVIELSNDELEGLMASCAATATLVPLFLGSPLRLTRVVTGSLLAGFLRS